MYDPDEWTELEKRYEELVPKLMLPEVQARMIAAGLDPQAELKRLAAAKDRAAAAELAAATAVEQLLQATADMADALYELFKGLRQGMQELKEANPLDPRLEELEECLEAMAEEMPKGPEA